MDAALAYLHFASIMLLTAFLVSELCLCTPRLRLEQLPMLARLDVLYLVAAIAALASGALRVFVTGKGPGFYLATRCSTSSSPCSSPSGWFQSRPRRSGFAGDVH